MHGSEARAAVARITVVNDNPAFLELVAEILADDRHQSTLIDGDLGNALQQIKDSRPDVLMIDLRMGGERLHGWEIAQQVRRDPDLDGIPVLVCSADIEGLHEIAEDLARTQRVRALQKPFGIDDLYQAIDDLLAEATPS